MNKREDIRDFLRKYHKGAEKAVYSSEMERLFSVDGRYLRRMISALRKEGCPICSDQNGYYYAKDQRDINATVSRLNDLVTSVSNARTGLLFASLADGENDLKITITIEPV